MRGAVAYSKKDVVMPAEVFVAQVVILNHPGFIRVGYRPVVFCGTASVACTIVEIKQKKAKKGHGKELDFIQQGDMALIVMKPRGEMVVETFKDCKRLGNLIIRDGHETVAIGKVKEVTKKE